LAHPNEGAAARFAVALSLAVRSQQFPPWHGLGRSRIVQRWRAACVTDCEREDSTVDIEVSTVDLWQQR